MIRYGTGLLLCLVLAAPVRGEDESPAAPAAAQQVPAAEATGDAAPATTSADIDLETTAIKGSQELPRVLVIVPWKKAQPGKIEGRPANSLLDEALAPLDREVFARQLEFYTQITTGNTDDKPAD